MSPEQTIEHKVAMAVCGLTSDIATLIQMSREPQARDLLGQDYVTLLDAHTQLGRVLGRLPLPRSQEVA